MSATTDLQDRIAAGIYEAMCRANGQSGRWFEAALCDREWCLRLAAGAVPVVETYVAEAKGLPDG